MPTTVLSTQPETPLQVSQVVAGITVRRMYHKPAKAFLKMLAVHLAGRAEFFVPRGDGAVGLNVSGIIEKLPDLVTSAEEIADHLVNHSIDDPAAVEKLDFVNWLEVLRVALELNAGDDLKNSFAGIGRALAPLLAGMNKTGAGA